MKPVYIVLDGFIDKDIIFTSDYGAHTISILLSKAHIQLTEHGAYEIGYHIWSQGDEKDLSEEDINNLPSIEESEFILFLQTELNKLHGKYVVVTLATKPVIN